MIDVIRYITYAALIYLAAGFAFAVPFALLGAPKIDPAARNTGWAFRLLIVPGSAAFWPLLAFRWAVASELEPDDGEPILPTTVTTGSEDDTRA
ncbi:MAG: hypothetical protein AAGI17_09265 [Planctomycetota bacterium]